MLIKSVAFSTPEGQDDAWLAVVIFEYRNVDSIGALVSGDSDYTMVGN